jgi:putative DNA primase/helicase
LISALRQNPRPGNDERPCFWLVEEPVEIQEGMRSRQYKPGVYYFGTKTEKAFGRTVEVPVEAWLCSPIRLKARTIEWPDGAQGVRLDVHDGSGWRDVVLPRETLASRRHREILLAWAPAWKPKARTLRRGWWNTCNSLRPGGNTPRHAPAGTTAVRAAGRCRRNGRDHPVHGQTGYGRAVDRRRTCGLAEVGCGAGSEQPPAGVFNLASLCRAAAQPTGHNAVLVQLVGRSTTGKTTCLLAANSVVGPPELVTTWRTTDNGLEQKALTHCDGFLALDEIGQVEPKTLDNSVYTLANGTAKQRAKAYEHGVGAVPTQRWRVAALSTGEKTIETLLALDKRNVNAGQAVRFIEIPAEERHGAFTELHGYESGAALADALRKAVRQYYGTPIRAFLEKLSGEGRDALNQVLDGCTARLLEAVKDSDATPGAQASRVLASVALVAAAGELATSYGITGWKQGEALEAALHCYRLWAQRRAAGTDFEVTALLRQMRDFITRHTDSRFTPVDDGAPDGEARTVVYDRAGYYRDRNGDREYLFYPEAFREATCGIDFLHARQELLRLGVLIPGGKHDSQSVRVGKAKVKMRVYVVSLNALNHALEQVEGGE